MKRPGVELITDAQVGGFAFDTESVTPRLFLLENPFLDSIAPYVRFCVDFVLFKGWVCDIISVKINTQEGIF